jgi:hypothetical protein
MAIRPVSQAVTQAFGVRNSVYRLGYHAGTDFGSPTGTPIKATTGGYVRWYGGWNGGYGNVIALFLSNGDVVWHAHCQYVARTGNVVKGTIIGYTDNTGYTFGAHLHVEYRIGGDQNRPIDFMKWLAAHPETPSYPRTVKVTAPAYVRSAPRLNAPLAGSQTLNVGDVFTSVGLVAGDSVGGNNKWHKSSRGNYVWSGNTNVRS